MSIDKGILDINDSGISISYEYLRLLNPYLKNMINTIIRSADLFEIELNSCDYDEKIVQLKSQLKYCKNYLEKQNIERKLNKLYVERNKNK